MARQLGDRRAGDSKKADRVDFKIADFDFTVARRDESGVAGILKTIHAVGQGQLPPRYGSDVWNGKFEERLAPLLRPGMTILDIGAGATPRIAIDDRPPECTYMGLDIDAEELERAAPGSYSETVVSEAENRVPELEGRFDLVVSYMAMEHTHDNAAVIENIRSYLVPGGTLVAQLAGRWSPFSVANRLLPKGVGRRLMWWSHRRVPDSIFPAIYDRCSDAKLAQMLGQWSRVDVIPLYTAATYLLERKVGLRAYIGYEEAIRRLDLRGLAPYYLIVATK